MLDITVFIDDFPDFGHEECRHQPWLLLNKLDDILSEIIATRGEDYRIENQIAIHKSVVIEQGVTLKGPLLISENCFIGAHAYLRGPVFLDQGVKIGPGSEIKQSILLAGTAIAHLNYIGDSIIGRQVNFEAGSVAANHYNERDEKEISVLLNDEVIKTGCKKFGSLVGDHARIGANAVLSPGTLLQKYAVVGRLQLVEQLKNTVT
jgi:NDP-sugar pyrophosphorylase family protein